MSQLPDPSSITGQRRLEQHRDRWTSYSDQGGIESISDKLTAAELRAFDIFADYDDRFLEKISPDVSVAVWEPGAVLFEEGSYLDLAFFVAAGTVELFLSGIDEHTTLRPVFDLSRTVVEPAVPPSGTVLAPSTGPLPRPAASGEITFLASMDFNLPHGSGARLGKGELFGEIGALSGWPQSVTARATNRCQLVQIRIPALRAMKRKSPALKKRLDALYRERALLDQLKTTPLFSHCSDLFLSAIKEVVELRSCEPGETIVGQGEPVAALYLVRSGFVKLSQRFGEGDLAVSYLSKGMTLGEVELLVEDLDGWQVTATAVEHAELVEIPAQVFADLVDSSPKIEQELWRSATRRIKEAGYSRRDIGHAKFTNAALSSGLVQGTSMLAIDLESCTRCDDCVRACADTHGGRARFVREGAKHGNILIARSCYHCRDPVCLIGCPTGAIHRAGIDAVIEIDDSLCIGCGTCGGNCPYDAIVMHDTGETWPEDMLPQALRGQPRQVASKCDLCHDTGHEPACVSNCPQGCATRVGSLEEVADLLDLAKEEQ